MKLDELKQTWQQEDKGKSEQQLQTMVKQRVSDTFSKIRLRAVLESAALLLALLVFFTGLDAHLNATWVNGLLAAALLIGVANNWMLYRRVEVNTAGASVVTSLQQVHHRLQWQIGFGIAFSALLFIGVFAFLLLRVPMTEQKLLMVLFVLPAIIGVRTWFEVRQWQRSIVIVRDSLTELTGK